MKLTPDQIQAKALEEFPVFEREYPQGFVDVNEPARRFWAQGATYVSSLIPGEREKAINECKKEIKKKLKALFMGKFIS